MLETLQAKNTSNNDGLHMIKETELAQMLGYTLTQIRRQLKDLRPFLARHGEPLRLCKDDHVVVTPVGLAVLKRAKELADLCLTQREIRARLRAEFGYAADPTSALREERQAQLQRRLKILEDTVGQLEKYLVTRETELANFKNALAKLETSRPGQAVSSVAQATVPSGHSPVANMIKAVLAGVVGTGAMTILSMLAPLMGLPAMDVPRMLASFMGQWVGFVSLPLGWVMHAMIGIVLALVYAYVFASTLPGPGWVRGMIYGLGPWLMAQLVIMPMMDMGLFASATGSALPALASLLGHLVYGLVVGGIYGKVERSTC
ncbi:hypothetical protein HY230_05430 [Candidatus Acetothermia bacterium]|nr:hypothetical protein [Candidatus Acetothermia bacterium]